MAGIYATDSARRLFERLERKFTAFCDEPSEDGVFDVIFPMYHLREWIHPAGQKSYREKSSDQLTPEELVHQALHQMGGYQVVRSLCNAAKHFNAHELEGRTQVLHGFRVGMGRVSDSLGITHFVVDGRDIRDYLWPVFATYRAYFDAERPAGDPI